MELLERDTDLARLEAHYRQATAGRGRVVFLSGEAGVGKTTLIDAFRRRIAEQGDVRRFSCDALSTPRPLGPVRDLALALGLPIDERSFDGEAREQLFRAILTALSVQSRPLVLIGEDAHWSDGASLEILRFLGRRIGDLPILVIVSYRDDEIGGTHPLRLILGDLATAPSAHRLSLPPLSEEAVRQLASGSGRDAAALHRLTGGNPFFLTEVLASPGTGVPATVGDAVLARAARLSPEARAMLDVAAVIGATIDPDLLQRVAGPVLDAVDEVIARGLLRGSGQHLAFRHELARESILEAIAPPRRRLLHARVLATLQESPLPGRGESPEAEGDLALLAHHAEAAGDREAVLTFAIAAAEQAAVLHAHREAAAQYARALRFADALPAAERAHLFEGRAAACCLIDQGEEAATARQAALAIWRTLGNARKEGENLRGLSYAYWLQGYGPEAESAASAALDVLEALPPGLELAMTYGALAQFRMLNNDLDGTLLWGNRAITLAEQLGDRETLIHALATVGFVNAVFEHAQGEEELTRSFHLALADQRFDHAGRALMIQAITTLLVMRLDDAARRIAAALDYAIEHDLDFRRGYLLAIRAALRVRQGAWDTAEAEIEALLHQPLVSPVTRIAALTTLGLVSARRGVPHAMGNLDEALVLAERAGHFVRTAPVRAARAEAALLDGDVTRAQAEASAVRGIVFTHGNRWQRGEYAWLLWQCGEQEIPTDGLAEPYARQLAGDFAGAAAAWRALGCPYEEACALAASDDPAHVRRAVTTFEQLGAHPARQQAVGRLRALGERDLPVVRRGPRASTRAHPAGLTQREAEVLALLAEGLRNDDIAERLFLSSKTVRHHVSAIFDKLGVETRTEAARTAAQLGLLPPGS